MSFNEIDHVDWLSKRVGSHPVLDPGIGDDMAVVRTVGGSVLLSCDMLLDGVHFDAAVDSMPLIGRKSLACSLSDCAAMAVRPVAATISVALPKATPKADIRGLYEGILSLAGEFDVAIAGGDTTRWENPLAVDVAVLAEPYPGSRPVTRAGAVAGDRLYVTGKLGGSRLGRHLTFQPRVTEAKTLAEKLGHRLHGMIDISDGLSLDVWRLSRASGAGAILDESLLEAVVSDDAVHAATADGRPPLEHMLNDGEDFELLLAVDGDAGDVGLPLYPVGIVTSGGLQLRRTDGRTEVLQPGGYLH